MESDAIAKCSVLLGAPVKLLEAHILRQSQSFMAGTSFTPHTDTKDVKDAKLTASIALIAPKPAALTADMRVIGCEPFGYLSKAGGMAIFKSCLHHESMPYLSEVVQFKVVLFIG